MILRDLSSAIISIHRVVVVSLLGSTLVSSLNCSKPAEPPSRVEPVAAVYVGYGVLPESAQAVKSFLGYIGMQYDTLGTAALLSGGLSRYNLLIIPGGDARDIAADLGPIGTSAVAGYVGSGGGYLGLGAGAAVAAGDWGAWRGIPLLDGEAPWPVERIAPYGQVVITPVVRQEVELTAGLRNAYNSLYRWGPEFILPETPTAQTAFRYEVTGTAAMVFFEKGQGRVCLFGFQPEFEEGSPRDGTSFGDEFNDPETEWDILEMAVQYCLNRL